MKWMSNGCGTYVLGSGVGRIRLVRSSEGPGLWTYYVTGLEDAIYLKADTIEEAKELAIQSAIREARNVHQRIMNLTENVEP